MHGVAASLVRLLLPFILLLSACTHAWQLPMELTLSGRLTVSDATPGKVAVMVPFRSWHRTLKRGLEAIHRCVGPYHNYTIFVFEQADSTPFHKGLLLNAGFTTVRSLTGDAYDYYMVHDVDTICERPEINWFPTPTAERVVHVTPQGIHPGALYSAFIGGNLLFTRQQYEAMNGFTTLCFGYGKEDDNILIRLMSQGFWPTIGVSLPQLLYRYYGWDISEHLEALRATPFVMRGLWTHVEEPCDSGSIRRHPLLQRNTEMSDTDLASGLSTSHFRLVGAAKMRGHVRLFFDLSEAYYAAIGREEGERIVREMGSRAMP